MRYAIIAAGEGTRLSQEGMTVAKPMVAIGGEPLLCRLVRIFNDNGASHVVVALRDSSIAHLPTTEDTTIVYCSTPSSMHSFHKLKPHLYTEEPFILTTVDTVFIDSEFAEYVKAFRQAIADGYDGLMGVTDYIDDEKPLYVKIEDGGNEIEGFYDEPCSPFVSAGIYGLCTNALDTLERCVNNGESRMRNFQRALIREGKRLKAWHFSKVIDIDHVSDIAKAEELCAK